MMQYRPITKLFCAGLVVFGTGAFLGFLLSNRNPRFTESRRDVILLESITWNSVYNDYEDEHQRSINVMRYLLYDFFSCSGARPAHGSLQELMVKWIKAHSDRSDRKKLYDEIFSGVDAINPNNCVFKQGDIYIFSVPGGSAMVSSDYRGSGESQRFLGEMREKFEAYLMGK